MFRKSKAKTEAAEIDAKLSALVREFRQKISAVDALTDVGQRYMALGELQKSRHEVWAKGEAIVAPEAGEKMDRGFTIGKRTSLAAGTGASIAAFATGNAALIPICLIGGVVAIIPIGVAGVMIGAFGAARYQERHKGRAGAFRSAMQDFDSQLHEKRSAILQNDLATLASSPCFDELYKLNEIKSAFLKAAGKTEQSVQDARMKAETDFKEEIRTTVAGKKTSPHLKSPSGFSL